MALTESRMVDLGQVAADFSLMNTDDKIFTLYKNFNSRALLIAFICNHCPYVKYINHSFASLFQKYQKKGVLVIAINSNDVRLYPDDSPQKMKDEVNELGYTFPYLFDETQDVAKIYGATCTPDFFLFDKNKKLVYRGQYDDARPSNDQLITGKDLTNAVETTLSNKKIISTQKPSIGCNIKWK